MRPGSIGTPLSDGVGGVGKESGCRAGRTPVPEGGDGNRVCGRRFPRVSFRNRDPAQMRLPAGKAQEVENAAKAQAVQTIFPEGKDKFFL